MNFRADINGLRAWAVLAVMAFHFGIAPFTSGFAGVDVFFAISGYLMTLIVISGLEKSKVSTFSLAAFYVARARRILPALGVLCAGLLLIGWPVLAASDYAMLGTHAALSVVFLSNFKFWREVDYFGASSHEKWLLHTWSLSVEWQFYLLLPLALLCLWKICPGRRAMAWMLAVGVLMSLFLSIILTQTQPAAAFYLLPTRAWELLAGGLTYLSTSHWRPRQRYQTALEVAGLGLIGVSTVAFTALDWPGWHAALPVVGTLLVLAARRSGSIWTGNAWAQWMGNRSYSLYLWHWPVVVGLTALGQDEHWLPIVLGILLTLILGDVSWRYVEVPARRLLEPYEPRRGLLLVGSGALFVLLLGAVVRLQAGFPGRVSPMIEEVARATTDQNPRKYQCQVGTGTRSPSCRYGGPHLRVVVLGDSHANALVSAVAAAASSPQDGVMEWSYIACPTLIGVRHDRAQMVQHKISLDNQCARFLDWSVATLDELPGEIAVVVINRSAEYAMSQAEGSPGIPWVYFSEPHSEADATFLAEYAARLTETACRLAEKHVVYLMRPIPEMEISVPKTMARALRWEDRPRVALTLSAYHARQDFVWAAQDAARVRCGIRILDPLPYLCEKGKCFGDKDGRPIYFDSNHLNEFGNKLLVPMFRQIFKSQ